jgi:hypothetical protein
MRDENLGPANVRPEMHDTKFEVQPPDGVVRELRESDQSFEHLLSEAVNYLEDPDVDDLALARMYIERGFSEELAYWLVREAEVHRAVGSADRPTIE